MNEGGATSPLALLKTQRSHVLFVLSDANAGSDAAFLDWYAGSYRQAVVNTATVLSVRQYEQLDFDITSGQFAAPPGHYLGMIDLALDGAQEAEVAIARIANLHHEQTAAKAPTTWLYYPACEKVGRPAKETPSLLVVAFTNAMAGQEAQFREHYATCHIRRCLKISGFVSGQCYERALFQRPGALEAAFSTITVYEDEGTPQAYVESSAALIAQGKVPFPMLDHTRFTKWMYRPVS